MKHQCASLLVLVVREVHADGYPAATDAGWVPSGLFLVGWQKEYLATRISRALSPEPMLWTELFVNLPKGLFLDIWGSADLANNGVQTKFSDEFDFTVGWKGTFADLDVAVSAGYINVAPIDTWGRDDVGVQSFFVSKRVEFARHSLIPEVRIEHLSATDNLGGGAVFFLPNITHVWKKPFVIPSLSFFQQWKFVWQEGKFFNNDPDGIFLQLDAALIWNAARNVQIIPGVRTFFTIGDANDGRSGVEVSPNITVTFSF